jgi:FkbM family methyltransferase
MRKQIDFDFINQKLSTGLKLRFDIGLSTNMPNSINWLSSDNDVFVIGIEPHPNNFRSCEEYLNNSPFKGRCYLIEAAVDNVQSPTQKVFYGLGGPATGYDSGTSSLRKPKGRFVNSIDEVYNVDVIPLRYILDNIQYDYINLLKTDTQGNDLNVLKSLNNHLNRVYDIYAEYDESNDYEGGNTGDELDQFLFQNNFEKYESITAPSRNNKVEDCKYKNTQYSLYSYTDKFKILVSKETQQQNSKTWLDDNLNETICELDVINEFMKHIQDDYTILDIGAQSGCFTLLSKFYPKTLWYSFEPDSWNCTLLRQNLELNQIKNVIVSEDALSDRVGESNLKICHSHRGLNTLGENPTRFTGDDYYDYLVKTNTIDNLFLDTKIDLIKIDTEGSEYNIIIGGIETIKKYKPKILLEYYDQNLQQCGRTLDELNSLIQEINYEIIWGYEGSNVIIQHKDS